MLREYRKLYFEDVRKLCIDEKWFTKATNEEFEEFVNTIRETNSMDFITLCVLERIAEAIHYYSVIDYSEYGYTTKEEEMYYITSRLLDICLNYITLVK